MEEVLQAIGVIGLVVLVIVGLLAGWIASVVAGGRRGGYMAIGVIAAVATPFLLVAIGVVALAAYGLAAILVAALVGAAVVLLIAKLVLD